MLQNYTVNTEGGKEVKISIMDYESSLLACYYIIIDPWNKLKNL